MPSYVHTTLTMALNKSDIVKWSVIGVLFGAASTTLVSLLVEGLSTTVRLCVFVGAIALVYLFFSFFERCIKWVLSHIPERVEPEEQGILIARTTSGTCTDDTGVHRLTVMQSETVNACISGATPLAPADLAIEHIKQIVDSVHGVSNNETVIGGTRTHASNAPTSTGGRLVESSPPAARASEGERVAPRKDSRAYKKKNGGGSSSGSGISGGGLLPSKQPSLHPPPRLIE